MKISFRAFLLLGLLNLSLFVVAVGTAPAPGNLYRQAHAIGERQIPGTQLASDLYHLGRVAMAKGELLAAEEHFQRALNLYESSLVSGQFAVCRP